MINRTQAMKLLAWVLTLSMQACAASPTSEAVRPMHHTDDGFRNYPIIEDSSRLGIDFYWKRFISSFSYPVVPESHVIAEDKAISLYKELRDENTITWVGQSTLLIKVDGVTILTDPFFQNMHRLSSSGRVDMSIRESVLRIFRQ